MPTTTGSSTQRKAGRLLVGVIAVVIAGAVAVAVVLIGQSLGPGGAPETITVKLAGEPFELELKLDDESRRTGMMHREHLAEDAGMLFAFTSMQRQHFWMKNCLVDLDVIFIDAGGAIVALGTMLAPPPGTTEQQLTAPNSPYSFGTGGNRAQFVIELNAGVADKLGLAVGDRVDLPVDRLKRWAR